MALWSDRDRGQGSGGITMIDRRGEVAITDERRGTETQKGRKGASVACWVCVCVCVCVHA